MIKYRVSTWSLSPEAVEVTRETNCFVVLATGLRESKSDTHTHYSDTWQEAHQWSVDYVAEQLRSAEATVRRLKEKLDTVGAETQND